MRRRDYYWSLYHSPEKRQMADLRTDQAEAVFEAIPQADKKDWLIWREGFRSWKPFTDFPQLLIALRQSRTDQSVHAPVPPGATPVTMTGAAPPVVPVVERAAGIKNETAAATVSSMTGNKNMTTVQSRLERLGDGDEELSLDAGGVGFKDRDNARYPKRYEVRILGGSQVFVTQTVDVSLRGMQLRDRLPQGLPRYFNVELNIGTAILPMLCAELPPKEGIAGSRMRIEMNNFENALQTALLAN